MLQQQVSQGGGALAEQIAAGSLNPFSNQVRPPTLAECEAIIKHLQKVNENQAHEVLHLNPYYEMKVLKKLYIYRQKQKPIPSIFFLYITYLLDGLRTCCYFSD